MAARVVVAIAVVIALSACGGDDDAPGSVPGGGSGGLGGVSGAGGSGGGGGSTDAGFSITVGPAAAAILQGSKRWLKVDLTREPGFTGEVQIALANPPAGVIGDILTFSDELATEGFPIELGLDVPLGSLALTFAASSGAASANAELALDVQPAQPTSQETISEALLAATIDLGTSLLYRAYARFGDDRLPEEFRGSGTEEDLMLLRDIEGATPGLSAEAIAALRPFTVRPHHPESVYAEPRVQLDQVPEVQRTVMPGPLPPPEDCAGGNVWRSRRSAAVPVRVWIECAGSGSDAIERHSMSRVLQVFEAFWSGMTGLMSDPILDDGGPDEGGDDAIDVYLVQNAILRGGTSDDIYNLMNLGVTAYATWSPPYAPNADHPGIPGTSSGYVVFPRIGILGEMKRASMTHEFFHVLQFKHHDTYSFRVGTAPHWFVEASATWASVHFDRTLPWPARVGGQIHEGRFGRFQRDIKALNDPNSGHTYAAYIWPFFMVQNDGSQNIIRSAWNGLESATNAADADSRIDTWAPFATDFRIFALRNLNSSFMPGDPLPEAERYVSLDPLFPDESIQPIRSLAPLGNYTKGVDLPSLSAAYFLVTPEDDTIRRVEIDFSSLEPQTTLDIDALVHTPDGWLSEPLSLRGEGNVVFCFEKGPTTATVRGSFDAIELVLSNHARAIDEHVAGDLVITSSSSACSVWAGSMTATLDFTDVTGTLSQTTTADIVLEFDSETAMISGPTDMPYRLRGGTYQYDSLFESTGRDPPCRTIETASGAMHAALPADASPGATVASFTLFTNSQPATYFGGGYSYATITSTTNCNASNIDEVTSAVGLLTWWQSASAVNTLTADGLTATGSADVPDGLGRGNVHYDWSLTKQDE